MIYDKVHTHTRTHKQACLDIVGVRAIVAVPEKHADTIEQEWLAELHSNALATVSHDGVGRVALLSVVVLSVSIE